MKLTSSLLALAIGIGLTFSSGNDCQAQLLNGTSGLRIASAPIAAQSGRGPIIARGPERTIIQSTPIVLRPNRPLHFYGNIVRRSYNGQSIVPFVNRF